MSHANTSNPQLLVINGGSSSIKFALYEKLAALRRGLHGKLERIGLSGTNLTFTNHTGRQTENLPFSVSGKSSVAPLFIDWLKDQVEMESVAMVGHRVVHGMYGLHPRVRPGHEHSLRRFGSGTGQLSREDRGDVAIRI